MKIRHAFVPNSSTSCFVIVGVRLPDNSIEFMKQMMVDHNFDFDKEGDIKWIFRGDFLWKIDYALFDGQEDGDTGVYLVEDLKTKFKEMEFSLDEIISYDFSCLGVSRVFWGVGDLAQFVEKVNDLEDHYWITNAHDQDEAGRNNIWYEVFEGDL